MERYGGIDLGATHVRAAVADEDGDPVAVERRPTPDGPDGRAVADAVLGTLRRACGDAGIEPTALSGVGIASFGPLDLDRGAVASPPNLPDTVDLVPLRDPVADLAGTDRVALANDAAAGVVAERFYAGAPANVAYLTLSSGIGAGVAVDGNVLSGAGGNAGEVGHWNVDPRGRLRCGCGGEGHWEAYCSGENIPAHARLLADEEGIDTDLPLHDLDAADVFDRPDDPLAARTIGAVARFNAIGVANLVHAFAPSLVAVGGAVALENESAVIGPIRERVPDMVVVDPPEIRPTALGGEAVLRGAIALALP